jgi:starch synthase
MDILLVSSEFAPWVQYSGVAEVVASFSKTLKQVGHSVSVVVPHSHVYEEAGLLLARRLTPLKIDGQDGLTVFDTQLTSGVGLTLVSLGSEINGQGDARSAALFAQAVAALIKERHELSLRTDIVHVHDWFGGLVALALEILDGPRPPVVFTIYDVDQKGNVSLSNGAKAELGPMRDMPQLSVGRELNILAAAIRTASCVTTVSDAYAEMLRDPLVSGSLAQVVNELKQPMLGIPGGIDYARYNPAIDPLLVARYDAEDFSQKGTCKTALQRELGLELDLKCPMMFVPGSLRDDLGGQLIVGSLSNMLDQPLSVVVSAHPNDSAEMADAVRRLAQQWPKQLTLLPTDSPQGRHRALSAADFVLLTAQQSPLDSGHLLAQRYGALPIAIRTGHYASSLVDCDAKLETGSAFLFDEPSIAALTGAVARAVTAWGRPEFDRLRRRTMRQDLGWERPARRMLQVYRQILGIRL